MDAIRPQISFEELTAFHAVDRALYFALTFDLGRNPIECIEILALWILFERLRLYKNFVKFMLTKEPSILAKFADEALTCLLCIKKEGFLEAAEARGISLTSNLLRSDISPKYFSMNRAFLKKQIGQIISEVCTNAFPDMLKDGVLSHAAYDSWAEDMVAATAFNSPREDRTMFVTFSRGYPVDEAEVRVMFNALFGVDCIESFYMQKPSTVDEQPLYARIIFNSPETVDKILNGEEKAKLSVNNKHLWLRKYVSNPRPTSAN